METLLETLMMPMFSRPSVWNRSAVSQFAVWLQIPMWPNEFKLIKFSVMDAELIPNQTEYVTKWCQQSTLQKFCHLVSVTAPGSFSNFSPYIFVGLTYFINQRTTYFHTQMFILCTDEFHVHPGLEVFHLSGTKHCLSSLSCPMLVSYLNR